MRRVGTRSWNSACRRCRPGGSTGHGAAARLPRTTAEEGRARRGLFAMRRRGVVGLWVVGLLAVGLGLLALLGRFEYAPLPSESSLANPDRLPLPAADRLG